MGSTGVQGPQGVPGPQGGQGQQGLQGMQGPQGLPTVNKKQVSWQSPTQHPAGSWTTITSSSFNATTNGGSLLIFTDLSLVSGSGVLAGQSSTENGQVAMAAFLAMATRFGWRG